MIPSDVNIALGATVKVRIEGAYLGALCDPENPAVATSSGTIRPGPSGELVLVGRSVGRTSVICIVGNFGRAPGRHKVGTVTVTNVPCVYPPDILFSRETQTAVIGQRVTVSILVPTTAVLTYQWYRGSSGDESNPIPDSRTSATQVEVAPGVSRVWVRAFTSCGTVDSGTATVWGSARTRTRHTVQALVDSANLLWIAAHPDDEILAAPLLGEICSERRARCTFLVATRGEAGACSLRGGCGSDLGALRAAEADASARLFGARLVLGDLPDGSATSPEAVLAKWSEASGGHEALVQRLASEIVASGADTILTFDPRHGSTCHPDHRAISILLLEALETISVSTFPRVFFLESRVELSSAAESIAFLPAVEGDPAMFVYDANSSILASNRSRWEYVLQVAATHPSQFGPTLANVLRMVPAEQRKIYLLRLEDAVQDTRYEICEAQ